MGVMRCNLHLSPIVREGALARQNATEGLSRKSPVLYTGMEDGRNAASWLRDCIFCSSVCMHPR